MGTLFSTLDIARSGLLAAQVQIDTAGHNIANVNKDGYSRQRVELVSRLPNYTTYGALGRGVSVASVTRIRDEFLDYAYRLQVPALGNATVQAKYYARLEDIFLEPADTGFVSRLNDFFDTLDEFATNVEDLPTRQAVLAEAETFANSLNDVAQQFYMLRSEANEEVKDTVEEINSLSERIATLNIAIRDGELSGQTANDLRDDRGVLIDELAQLVNITVREQSDGQVNILVGSDVLVDATGWRELEAVRNPALDSERDDLVEVRFVESGELVEVTDGELYGALQMRDVEIPAYDDRIDTLAAAVISAINAIHCTSNGLDNLSGTVSSTNATIDAVTALNAAGLPFDVSSGTFDIIEYDASGNPTTITVTVDPTASLTALATAINTASTLAGASITASVSGGDTLDISSAASGFTFSNDTSGALTALGINGLFTGYDASTIAVSEVIADNPRLLSSGYSTDVLETGDNTAALAMAELQNAMLLDSESSTINDYYESTIVQIGIDAQANEQILDVEVAFVNDLDQRREEVSGVSLDEEVTFMIQFQRAYEASARVITVVNNMLDALLAMGR